MASKITTCLSFLAVLLTAARVSALPADPVPFKLPTCGATLCLGETNGLYQSCEPSDLKCLCTMSQDDLDLYVDAVQPCIDGTAGKEECTDGAIYQYKDLLTTVCAEDMFGGKTVTWPAA